MMTSGSVSYTHLISMKLDENERSSTIRLMKVKDMLLKDAIEEKQAQDRRTVEAFGGHLELSLIHI